jgi:hypothetical protein
MQNIKQKLNVKEWKENACIMNRKMKLYQSKINDGEFKKEIPAL